MAGRLGNEPRWVAEMEGVEWKKIDHAYGKAVDIPPMVRTIAFGAEADALKAYGELFNNLNHQGSIYPATGPAVPFVIEALRVTTAGPRLRAGLLHMLAGITEGAAVWVTDETTDTTAADPDADWGAISFRDVLAGAWRGAGLYTRLLAGDPNANVRMQAAHVLGVLAGLGPAYVPTGEHAGFDGVVAALLGREGVEEDGLALSSAAFALGRVVAHDPSVWGVLRRLLARTGVGEAVRVAAALALVEADGEQHTEAEAADVLVNTMSRAAETDLLLQPRTGEREEDVRRSPWVWGKLRFRLCRAPCSWSAGNEGRMGRVLPALLVGVRAANGYTAESDIGPVLRWLWPGRDIRMKSGNDGKWKRELPPAATADELTGFRRVVVEACYENTGVWGTRIGNTDLAFMRVGLPTLRADVRKLLEKT